LPKVRDGSDGDYTFELTVSDGRPSDTDTLNVGVQLRNRPPVATDEDTPLGIMLGASDVDGGALTNAGDGHETHDPSELAGGSTGRGRCVDQGPLYDSTVTP
jgi:hypothetical protein